MSCRSSARPACGRRRDDYGQQWRRSPGGHQNRNNGGLYRSDNVDIAAANDTGGGYCLGWVKAGEWVNYTIRAATAGTFTIDLRVASKGAGGAFDIEVNGVDKTGPLTIPNTGGWQAWTTISKGGVALGAGKQVIRVVMDTNGATGSVGNFNWFAIR